VSSNIAKAPGWEVSMFAGRLTIDGNPRSPWIAAVDDERPLLKIMLSEPQRANLVRIAPAQLSPHTPDFLTLPREISVSVNNATARTITIGPGSGTWLDLKLEKSVLVNTLEIRLLGREVAGAAVGIGEVVLEFTAN
jgi:hypothetical protein